MERHEGLETSYTLTANENRRRRNNAGATAGIFFSKSQGERGNLVVIELDDGGDDTDRCQESFHDVAHATRRSAEYDHGMLGYEPSDLGLR